MRGGKCYLACKQDDYELPDRSEVEKIPEASVGLTGGNWVPPELLGIRLVLLVLEQEDKRGRYDVDEAKEVHKLGEIDKRVGLSG